MPQDKPKPGLLTRRRELRERLQRLRDLRGQRASAARDRLVKRQEGLVKRAKANLERQERVARGESALPEPTTEPTLNQRVRDRRAAEKKLGIKRGREN